MKGVTFVKSTTTLESTKDSNVIKQEDDFSAADFYSSLCSIPSNTESKDNTPECHLCHNPVIDASTHCFSTPHNLDKPAPSHPVTYTLSEENKGYKLMAKMGWDHNQGLGAQGEGRTAPVATTLKYNRVCLGVKSDDPRFKTRKAVSHTFEDIVAAKEKTPTVVRAFIQSVFSARFLKEYSQCRIEDPRCLKRVH
jgi:hypothetical protein